MNQIVCAIRAQLKDILEKYRYHGTLNLEVQIVENDITHFHVSPRQTIKVT